MNITEEARRDLLKRHLAFEYLGLHYHWQKATFEAMSSSTFQIIILFTVMSSEVVLGGVALAIVWSVFFSFELYEDATYKELIAQEWQQQNPSLPLCLKN